MAQHIHTNIRELEGALNMVIAHATFSNKPINMTFIKHILGDIICPTRSAINLHDIERVVCRSFQVHPEALKSDSRARSLVYPRMLAMYLARKYTGASYSTIGQYFGGRNHSTVLSAEKKVAHWLSNEEKSIFLPGFERAADALVELERELNI